MEHKQIIVIIAAIFCLLLVLYVPPIPFTEPQFYSKVTDLNYSQVKSEVYHGLGLVFDGNKISVTPLLTDVNWCVGEKDVNAVPQWDVNLGCYVKATLSDTNTGDQDLSGYALKTNVLELNNVIAFTPDADYEPATKKYVDDEISLIPTPDLSEYARLDGANFSGDVNVVGNISASNSINWGGRQANAKNSYMNLPIRSSDWNTEVHFFDAEVLPKYTSGTITQWDVMNSQSKSMPTIISCRTSNGVNSNCILAFMGRNPATSSFYANSTIGSARHIKNFVTRVKLWDINAKIVIGSMASGEISATLANYWTKGNGVNFLSEIDENGNGTWGYRCGNSNSINDSGVSIDNNKWYVLRITGNQEYGFGLSATSFDFFVDENLIGTCTPSHYAYNNDLYYSTIGFWTQNTTATTTYGQDIVVVDWVYVEENRWDYDDLYNFKGGSSSP